MAYSQKQLAQKGFVPVSARAAMVGGEHRPPESCIPNDYIQLPPQVQSKYDPTPVTNGRVLVHKRR